MTIMKEIMFNFGVIVMAITYCLFVHTVVKLPNTEGRKKMINILFTLLLIEMMVMSVTQI